MLLSTHEEHGVDVEICGGQSCTFLGRDVFQKIAEGTSGMQGVQATKGECRGNCHLAPNVYVSGQDAQGDPQEIHFTHVDHKKGKGETSSTNVLFEVKKNRFIKQVKILT